MVACRAGVFWCKNAHLSERLFKGCHFRRRKQFFWFCFSSCCFVVFHFYWNVPIRKLSLILTCCLHSAKKLLIRQILCNERQRRRQLWGRLSKVFLRSNDTAPTFPSRFFSSDSNGRSDLYHIRDAYERLTSSP